MLDKLQKFMTALSEKADRHAAVKALRTTVAMGAKTLRTADDARRNLAGIGAAARFHAEETGSWVTIDQFRAGERGPFDACDIRLWLSIAEIAGVDTVPAKEILRLDEGEMSLASGQFKMPETRATRAAGKGLAELARELIERGDVEAMSDGTADRETQDLFAAMQLLAPSTASAEELDRKLGDAMDDVPEGWMVRSARTGPSNLKALAGAGFIGHGAPEVFVSADLGIGPGWVRRGNRRFVNAGDGRTVEAAAQGPNAPMAFLARPWVEASRKFVTDDPNRENTPIRGKGVWPAEWRAFIQDGQVIGVSFYYSWAGEANAENARMALAVREAAQKIADRAVALGMWPRYMDVEFMRRTGNKAVEAHPQLAAFLEELGREKVACTLDFIETDGGLKLLEGGPAMTPFGGGHPCGFAGCGGQPFMGSRTETVGVAFRNMPQVIIAEPRTWNDGDRTDCILSWDETLALAAEPSAAPSP